MKLKKIAEKLFDGTKITTYTRDVVSANVLQVEAGTTGYKGGDTGHGGRTYSAFPTKVAQISSHAFYGQIRLQWI